MEEELRPFIKEYKLTVTRLYIDNDESLKKLYGDKVPVLTLDNEIVCHYFLDKDILYKTISEKID